MLLKVSILQLKYIAVIPTFIVEKERSEKWKDSTIRV